MEQNQSRIKNIQTFVKGSLEFLLDFIPVYGLVHSYMNSEPVSKKSLTDKPRFTDKEYRTLHKIKVGKALSIGVYQGTVIYMSLEKLFN